MGTSVGYNPLQFLDDAGISRNQLANTHTTDLKLAWLGEQFIEQGLNLALSLLSDPGDQNRARSVFQAAIQLCRGQERKNGVLTRSRAIAAIGSQQEALNLYVQKAITGFDFLDICAFNVEMWNSPDQLAQLVSTIQGQLHALEQLQGNEQFNAWLQKLVGVALKRARKLESDALAEELTAQGLPEIDSTIPLIRFIEIILAGKFPRNGLTLLHHILDPMLVGPAMMQVQELVRYEGVITRGTNAVLAVNNEFFAVNPLGVACLPVLDEITVFALGGYGINGFAVACVFSAEMWEDQQLLLNQIMQIDDWPMEDDLRPYIEMARAAAVQRYSELAQANHGKISFKM